MTFVVATIASFLLLSSSLAQTCFNEGSCSSLLKPQNLDCHLWSGIQSSYDSYCRDLACPFCYRLTDLATHKECYELQMKICRIPSKATFTKRVIYLDWSYGDLEDAIHTSVDNGYNIIVLSFWLFKQRSYWDAARRWMSLSSANRQLLLTYAHSRGAKITLSVGGSGENHAAMMRSGLPGSVYGKSCAEKVIEAGLDGLNFDSVGWNPHDFRKKKGTQWLIDATKAAHQILGSGKIISHAPQAPYFSIPWAGRGGYGEIERQVRGMIDYYFVKYYNQGASYPYNTYDSLFVSAQGGAVKEIIAQGVPQDKIVVGKYVTGGGSSGYVKPDTLKHILCKSHRDTGFTAGGGIWVYDIRHLDETKKFGHVLSTQC